ncbi:formylglycine-generating enzyme family protein [Aquimarina sp. 2201CG14-23]|uniref:formylglycine-generating enzyme family protein n=1 Tax=Aquimarina mycalae TaxID=3040073 RepID=UPI002477F6A2|nr:formylglycine-generating enzyme family protein [Aquimarina sp. 2201CG14-23]MDH7444071.1 formylglycine-generating enzyme family protein [Aquimarina sp. 2201CG14-23]
MKKKSTCYQNNKMSIGFYNIISAQNRFLMIFLLMITLVISSCNREGKIKIDHKEEHKNTDTIPEGMVWIPKGVFYQGAKESDSWAMSHEKPRHVVSVDSFLIDITEVTNAKFTRFVQETGYITLAERPVDWDEIKKQLPPGTPKPHDSLLQPGSLIFKERSNGVTNLYDFSQWWLWKIGANWRQPQGPGSSIKDKENHSVVHIAYEDALAYCKWAGRELPTEAQWEYAATGGQELTIFTWGNDPDILNKSANTYTGNFPIKNDKIDGFFGSAPVASYVHNAFGIYDMAGNVWEWTSDWYVPEYYTTIKKDTLYNPKGAAGGSKEKVIKGGSFLCNASYCASYRISSRMGNSLDSSSEHKGFRTVINK